MEVRVGIEASRVVDDTQVIEKIKRHNPQKLSKHSVNMNTREKTSRAPRSNPGGGDRRRELPREKRFSREWRIQRGP
jgi:hypothetical protein